MRSLKDHKDYQQQENCNQSSYERRKSLQAIRDTFDANQVRLTNAAKNLSMSGNVPNELACLILQEAG